MNDKLKVETFREGIGVKVWKISGFTSEEFRDLVHNPDYREMKKEVLRLLDVRNNNLGTKWYREYGVFHVYTHGGYPECIFVETGVNCG